jgi:outer membrane protein TolC
MSNTDGAPRVRLDRAPSRRCSLAAARGLEAALALALAVSLAGPARAGTGDSLTVEQCVRLARRQAPALLATRFEHTAASYDSIATSRNARPDFSITAGGTVAPEGFYDPTITNLGDYELKLGMDWPVFDGGGRARARRRGGLALASARSQQALESRDAGLQAAGLAFRLLSLSETESYQSDALDWLARLGTLVRAGVASGGRSSADSIRVALERDAVTSALADTRLAERVTTLDLLTLLGRGADTSLVVVPLGEGQERPPTAADSMRLLESATKQPEVALARTADAAARLDLADARHRTAARVDLAVDAGLAGADLTHVVPPDLKASDPNATLADRLRRDLGASAAVRFRLPILDGAARPSREAREAALRASETRSRSEVLDQRRLALALLARWRSTYERTEAARVTSRRAADNLIRLKSLYSAGATTLLDLLDARRVDDDALERLAEARWEERMAQFDSEDRE